MNLPEVPIADSYEAYACKVNALSVAELFQRYEEAGFLYPAKKQRLAPFLPLVQSNWEKGLRGGELIHYVISYDDPESGAWATISVWRSTHKSWNSQHLVSVGGPSASRVVMLAQQAVRIHDEFYVSGQNWFQETNRFANKVFGSMPQTLGPEAGAVNRYSYISIPLGCCGSAPSDVTVISCKSGEDHVAFDFASRVRGPVYAAAEELEHEDIELDALDQLYSLVGLRRFRRVFLAFLKGQEEPVGAVLAYRGPLGFNFSFLENRCDLLVQPSLPDTQKADVVWSLLHAAAGTYGDFPLQSLLVVTEPDTAPLLTAKGGEVVREYSQSIWLKNGYERWYRHVEKFYDRITLAGRRCGVGAAAQRPALSTSGGPV